MARPDLVTPEESYSPPPPKTELSPVPPPPAGFPWGPVLGGAIIAAAIIGMGLVLTVGLGAFLLGPDHTLGTTGKLVMGMSLGIFGIFGYFVGGASASNSASDPARRGARWPVTGLGVWAVTLVATTLLITLLTFSPALTFLKQALAGLGLTTLSPTVIEELAQRQIVVVSDLQVFDGKLVSRLRLTDPEANPSAAEVLREGLDRAQNLTNAPVVSEAAREAGETLRQTTAQVGTLAALGLLFSGAASLGGAYWNEHRNRNQLASRWDST